MKNVILIELDKATVSSETSLIQKCVFNIFVLTIHIHIIQKVSKFYIYIYIYIVFRGKVQFVFIYLWVIIRCLNQQESSPFDDPAPPEDAKIILRAFLFYGNSPRWNPHWGGDGTYLSKGFQTSASTRRVRRRDAATFD